MRETRLLTVAGEEGGESCGEVGRDQAGLIISPGKHINTILKQNSFNTEVFFSQERPEIFLGGP